MVTRHKSAKKHHRKKHSKFKLNFDTEKLIIVAVIVAIAVFATIFAINPLGITAQFELAAKQPLTSFTIDGPLSLNQEWVDIYDTTGTQVEHANVYTTHLYDTTNSSKFVINIYKTSDIYLVKSSATGYNTYYKDTDNKIKFCCVLFI